MKDYYSLFVSECLKLCRFDDYSNSQNVKIHNNAMKAINRIKVELVANNHTEILMELMYDNNELVRLNAATICIQLDIYTDKAKKCIERINETTKDKSVSFSCEMVLQTMAKNEV